MLVHSFTAMMWYSQLLVAHLRFYHTQSKLTTASYTDGLQYSQADMNQFRGRKGTQTAKKLSSQTREIHENYNKKSFHEPGHFINQNFFVTRHDMSLHNSFLTIVAYIEQMPQNHRPHWSSSKKPKYLKMK